MKTYRGFMLFSNIYGHVAWLIEDEFDLDLDEIYIYPDGTLRDGSWNSATDNAYFKTQEDLKAAIDDYRNFKCLLSI